MIYCTDSDLYNYGLPRGSIPNPGRLVASASTSTGALTLDVHGFADDDPLTFRAEAGGTLPAPIVAGTTYYAIAVDDNSFRVSATAGGAPLTLTTAGSRTVVITPLPLEASRAWASRIVDQSLPAHLVPLAEPFPDLVVMTTAELAIGKLLQGKGSTAKSLVMMVADAQKMLARWAKGVPLRGENVPPRANLAASATLPYADPRGWGRYGGR